MINIKKRAKLKGKKSARNNYENEKIRADVLPHDNQSFRYEFNKTRIVASCLTNDETKASYEWCFNMFKEATESSYKVIFTDADPAVQASIINVFPDARHLWCNWHLSNNIVKNTSAKLGEKLREYLKDFSDCQKSTTLESFEMKFDNLFSKCQKLKYWLSSQKCKTLS
jgi:hypothetical protein